MLGTISAFAYRHRETKKNLCRRWPVAGPSEYWLLASSPASKVKNSNTHIVQQIHITWQQYTQDNYNNSHGQTNNNYTQDSLKLAIIHTRQIRIKHLRKKKTEFWKYFRNPDPQNTKLSPGLHVSTTVFIKLRTNYLPSSVWTAL